MEFYNTETCLWRSWAV